MIDGKSIYTDYLKSLGLLGCLQTYLRDLEAKPDEVRRFIAEPLPIPAEHYIDSFIARRVERYIEHYDLKEPSFVYVGFQGPHEPWDAPDQYANLHDVDEIPDPIPELPPGDWLPKRSLQYQQWAQYYQPPNPRALKEITARYYGKIAQIDNSVGRILDAYEGKGWLDNTIVIFASDHGEMLGDLGRVSKSVFYESALHVPLIIRLPNKTEVGSICDALVETIDIYATILDLAGSEMPMPQHNDSRSLLPLIEHSAKVLREDILSEVHAHYMLRTEQWKLVIGRDGLTLQLFDLDHDPMEQHNLCMHPDFLQQELEMRSRLLTRITRDTLRAGTVDPEYCGHFAPSRLPDGASATKS